MTTKSCGTIKNNEAYDEFDLMDALESAAEFVEKENWGGATTQQISANKEASKRIMRMVDRLQKKALK